MTSRLVITRFHVIALLVGLFGSVAMLTAGPLDPPAGPIAPTAKPLSEVEPRIAINATNTPGDADSLFRITQPGSYYLTGNTTGVAGKSGIEVAADNVTIDLNGFTLQGVGGSLSGVVASGTPVLTVMNGSVRGWGGAGVVARRAERLVVANNLSTGILLFNDGTAIQCNVANNGSLGLYGISAGARARVADCTVTGNGGSTGGGGIVCSGSSVIERCIVNSNGSVSTSNASAYGIAASNDCLIMDCRVDGNGASSAASSGGILAGIGTNVLRCYLYGNPNVGIRSDGEAVIAENSVGGTGTGPAILTVGTRSRVEANHVFNSNVGIRVSTNNCVVIRNSARGNLTNYDIAAGNDVGPIGSAATATSPWANLQGP
jgi:hypothetical protein